MVRRSRIKGEKYIAYAWLIHFQSRESIDTFALAKMLNRSQQSIAALIKSASSNPNAYLALRERRYLESQIPAWFARPKAGQGFQQMRAPQEPIKPKLNSGSSGRSLAETDTRPTSASLVDAVAPSATVQIPLAPYGKFPVVDLSALPVLDPWEQKLERLQSQMISELRDSIVRECREKFEQREKERQHRSLPMGRPDPIGEFFNAMSNPAYRREFFSMDFESMISFMKLVEACAYAFGPQAEQIAMMNYQMFMFMLMRRFHS